ncbi:hypothetical protein MMC26_007354 [Xylographa opegraphella]|nr:hypothetical protein [Xylographa opegraphella]
MVLPQHAQALGDYIFHCELDRGDPDRYAARRRLDAARIDRIHQEYNDENYMRSLLAARPAHLQPIPLTREERDLIHGPSARIDTTVEHVDEEEYRDPGDYWRRTRYYMPGRYADTSGQGYVNTSDPDDERRESRGRDRAATQTRTRDPTPHPRMYDEDELRELMDQQSAAEEADEYEEEEELDPEEEEEQIRRIKDKLNEYKNYGK